MSEMVTVEISETTARIIRDLAARTGRAPERILRDIIDRGVEEIPVDSLSDDQVLALCNLTMTAVEQTELNDLLDDQREGQLSQSGRIRLDELMQIYRRGLVRKSEALKVAVQRGLRSPLG